MAITAASIEANGWVLRLDFAGTLGSYASYALTPDATPKLALTGTHPGFDVSAGTAVANAAKARAWVGTKPVRKPITVTNAGVMSTLVVDETDLGAGSIRVRIALSKRVYATDAALSLTALANWHGTDAGQTIAVTNSSTQTAPVPIHRWADVPYQLRVAAFDLELLVMGFGPQGAQPIAGVKFTVTDGTTIKTYWSTALSASTQYGDALRCHRVTVDPAIATALTAGLLRCDAEVYPWIGAMRTTDTAGTKSMTGLTTGGFKNAAQAPFVVAWDPARTRYTPAFVYVDYTNGTITAAAAMVQTTLTLAKGVAPAARAKDCTTAIEAIFLANRSYAAGNGQAATGGGFWIIDAAQIVLAPQVHAGGFGAGGGTFGTSSLETWAQIVGDPADANPRANCIIRTSTGNQLNDNRLSRAMFANLTIEAGFNLSRFINYQWFDNVEVRGQTGKTTDATVLSAADPGAGNLGLHFTRTKIWQSGLSLDSTFGGSGNRPKIIRKCEWRRRAEAPVVVTGRLITEAEDSSFTGLTGGTFIGSLNSYSGSTVYAAGIYDSILAYNDLRANRERIFGLAGVFAADAGTAIIQLRRLAVFGNVLERIGNASTDAFMSMGELNEPTNHNEIIWESNTAVGARCNFIYNDPSVGSTVAETDAVTRQSEIGEVRVANNVFDWHPVKHDTYEDPAVKAQRVAASDPRVHGFRPQLLNGLAEVYGVGHEGNIELWRDPLVAGGGAGGNFFREYEGLRSRSDRAFTDAKYTSDTSVAGGDGASHPTFTGLGNYKPLAGSPLIGRATNGNSDIDLFNVTRLATFTAGAIEADATSSLGFTGTMYFGGVVAVVAATVLSPIGFTGAASFGGTWAARANFNYSAPRVYYANAVPPA